jgi:E3 ubiquitin-protein ligase makorin
MKCIFINSSTGCRKGSNCEFSHSADQVTNEQIACRYFKKGNCKRGNSCFYKHDLQNQTAQQTAQQTVGNRTEEIVCSVCYEDPLQFGLLNGCDHVFCLKCVREWRNSKTKDLELGRSNVIKECPLCRVKSDFVVPSFKFMTGQEKEKEIQAYKTKLEKIPCKYFNRRGRYYRVCPFGDICFYAHTDQDGKKLSCTKGPPQYARNRRELQQLLGLDVVTLTQQFTLLQSMRSPLDWEEDEDYEDYWEDGYVSSHWEDNDDENDDDENDDDDDDENHWEDDDENNWEDDDEDLF